MNNEYYSVNITALGIEYTHEIKNDDDLQVLIAVLDKIRKNAQKFVVEHQPLKLSSQPVDGFL